MFWKNMFSYSQFLRLALRIASFMPVSLTEFQNATKVLERNTGSSWRCVRFKAQCLWHVPLSLTLPTSASCACVSYLCFSKLAAFIFLNSINWFVFERSSSLFSGGKVVVVVVLVIVVAVVVAAVLLAVVVVVVSSCNSDLLDNVSSSEYMGSVIGWQWKNKGKDAQWKGRGLLKAYRGACLEEPAEIRAKHLPTQVRSITR